MRSEGLYQPIDKFRLVITVPLCYTIYSIRGYDGIGRHARFRFSYGNVLGFESPYPHHDGDFQELLPDFPP